MEEADVMRHRSKSEEMLGCWLWRQWKEPQQRNVEGRKDNRSLSYSPQKEQSCSISLEQYISGILNSRSLIR